MGGFKNKLSSSRELPFVLQSNAVTEKDKGPEYLRWLDEEMVSMVNDFAAQEKLLASSFVQVMNRAFDSTRFNLLVKKWLVDYFIPLFSAFDACSGQPDKVLTLEDNPANRYAYDRYKSKFNRAPNIKWLPVTGKPAMLLSLILTILKSGLSSLKSGVRITSGKKRFKVMREALWGLYEKGSYFHDNFMVDGDLIKDNDLLLFSRGVPPYSLRLFAYNDARRSAYAFFNLERLPLSLPALFLRIIPKYLKAGARALYRETGSPNYSLYLSLFVYFCSKAIPYEKVFANYRVGAELGHNYYSATHIPEAIVCQSHGAKYYLMHWSDNATWGNRYVSSFLACDKYFLWGRAHIQGHEGAPEAMCPIGYVFKSFINEAAARRDEIMKQLAIPAGSKVVAFFDESFGGDSGMLEQHHLNLWRTALELAGALKDIAVVIKPKIDVKYLAKYSRYSEAGIKKFQAIYDELKRLPNAYVIAPAQFSFIEIIGIADVVVTQGMTSSATIALICGKEGLYFHQSYYYHPFVSRYPDRLVFNEPAKLRAMVEKIISGEDRPSQGVPEALLREYDAYADDKGIDRFRSMLV